MLMSKITANLMQPSLVLVSQKLLFREELCFAVDMLPLSVGCMTAAG